MRDDNEDYSLDTGRENWSLTGPRCIVKVVPLDVQITSTNGYFTQGKYLLLKNPREIGQALGLPEEKLADGATIYKFARLPLRHEYQYELTARFPDGLSYNPKHGDPRYRPGSNTIHQWSINKEFDVPLDASSPVRLLPGQILNYSLLCS